MKFKYIGYFGDKITKETAEQLAYIEAVSFYSPWSAESIISAAESGYVTYIAANTDESASSEKPDICAGCAVPAGFACVQEVLGEAEILRIAVLPELRGMGIGRKVLCEALTFLKKIGACKVFLEVRASNCPAQSLYLSVGFEKLAVRKNYYADGEDAVIMCLKLDKC